jgi:hypothetical protein
MHSEVDLGLVQLILGERSGENCKKSVRESLIIAFFLKGCGAAQTL